MEKQEILKQLITKYKLNVFNTLEFDYDYSYISALLKAKNFQQYTSETYSEFCERICFLDNPNSAKFKTRIQRRPITPLVEKEKIKKTQRKKKHNPNSTKSLVSYMKSELRNLVISKADKKCQCCGKSESKEKRIFLGVYPILSINKFPEFALDIKNYEVLCNICKQEKKHLTNENSTMQTSSS